MGGETFTIKMFLYKFTGVFTCAVVCETCLLKQGFKRRGIMGKKDFLSKCLGVLTYIKN